MKKSLAKLVSQIKTMEMDDGSEDLVIQGYANTVTKDRAGDVIPAETWRKSSALTNYLKNPIILAYHDHDRPIGTMIDYEVTELGLNITAKISKGAGDVYHLVKDGVLKTFSVGFWINDAEYDQKSDTFFINEVELHEVSVVSVPCNQDSTFSVAKSLGDESYKSFKEKFINTQEEPVDNPELNNEVSSMDLDQLKSDLLGELGGVVKSTLQDAEAAKQAEEAAKAKAKAEKEAREAEVKAAAKAEAETIVKSLEDAMKADKESFGEIVKAQQETIVALKDEIASVVNSRAPVSVARSVGAAVKGQDAKEIDNVVMLGMIKKTGMFETNYGKAHKAAVTKAPNSSSSIVVSSDEYETVFSTNLIRDIQDRLVLAPLFDEIMMNSAHLTIPINPDRSSASWVDASDFGTDASAGNEITVTLTEKTLQTFKLAAKTYITEETQEDAILPLIPLLRSHLVEAHAKAIDTSFISGSGSGQPKGLVTQSVAAGSQSDTTATHTGTVKVTAKMILQARRNLGKYGISMNEVALVISQDAYWDLLEDDEWADVQQVGTVATKLNGEVGNIYGMPVIVSDNFPAKTATAAFGILVNRSNFIVARQRGATVRSDFDVEKDRRVFVATQRLNLEPMIEASAGNGKGVVAIRYAA